MVEMVDCALTKMTGWQERTSTQSVKKSVHFQNRSEKKTGRELANPSFCWKTATKLAVVVGCAQMNINNQKVYVQVNKSKHWAVITQNTWPYRHMPCTD